MIWYLLSPIRGTSDPPRLANDNLIRRAFYRHGMLTAQYWLAAMLISCGIAAALAYPTVFISGNPTAGFTSKPHQVWAAARTVSENENLNVDIEMRQIWVHGTYMRALDKDVLQSALKIQQALVGDEDLTAVSSPVSWAFHSPLMYWNNSATAIQFDEDITKTVNDRSGSSSLLEVSLRPASVFAGKIFSHRKLVAADALVLTLMNRAEDILGHKWQQKMHSLEDEACPQCQFYPPQGEVSQSWLYEFTFTPVTARENTALAFAYTCAVLYVLLSLRRLKAFHSRFGLVVTAITQMVMSVLASFTICGMLKVNLTAVPRNAYPFILTVIGLENMFRLINAILAYPPTMATDLRIANALGDVGPLSIATAAQNTIILWLLSLVVSPGIVAFCTFAAIATLVDTFFLLTFFIAVLNVDIRRLELQDSIARGKDAAQRTKSPTPQRSWFDALLYGGLPFSTRMAGSVVTTSFILTLNFLFFERTEQRMSLQHIIGLVRGNAPGPMDFDTLAPPPMNATLTPGEWIRMQDFDTAREVMRLVNAGAQSFVIRVYSPLVVVLAGADRAGLSGKAWADELREFTVHHLYPFLVVVVFIVTFVAVLMNFLLWNEAPEVSEQLPDRTEEALIVEHISTAHKLDIVKISCAKGNIATIALDRTVNISVLDRSQGTRQSMPLSTELASVLRWPVHNVAIDDSGVYIAFHTGDDVVMCNRQTNTIEATFQYPDHQPSVVFEFTTSGSVRLILLTAGAQLVVQSLHKSAVYAALQHSNVVTASLVCTRTNIKLITIRDDALLDCHEILEDTQHLVAERYLAQHSLKSVQLQVHSSDSEPPYVSIRMLNAFELLAIDDLRVLRRVETISTGLYISSANDSYYGVVKISDDNTRLELEVLYERESDQADAAKDKDHLIANPEAWISLPYDAILGLRRKPRSDDAAISSPQQLRRRRMSKRSELATERHDYWEAYSLSLAGDYSIAEFDAALVTEDATSPLFVTKAGPIAVLDGRSAVFAFGNCLKIVKMAKMRPARPNGPERHGSIKKRGGIRKVQ
ncbi:hypothetical protein AMS68_007052 [Peltaster fructicola]|uniref:SSD domain-containing protein n=1 Tax=Peltaster fructicola TaxID=286661 RepID=A0A6H0Y3N0_9PEZI|nr:hypothetical protein AMS68_007052 [Peltaster fructicola]